MPSNSTSGQIHMGHMPSVVEFEADSRCECVHVHATCMLMKRGHKANAPKKRTCMHEARHEHYASTYMYTHTHQQRRYSKEKQSASESQIRTRVRQNITKRACCEVDALTVRLLTPYYDSKIYHKLIKGSLIRNQIQDFLKGRTFL